MGLHDGRELWSVMNRQSPAVHIVSNEKEKLLAREFEPNSKCAFTYGLIPRSECTNVFFGIPEALPSPGLLARSIFVLTEPPEIMRYDIRLLESFGLVIGPRFGYLRGLKNFEVARGVLLWRIGANPETGAEYPVTSRSELEALPIPTGPRITAVVSGKSKTRMQRDRLALVHYLEKKLDNFYLFGRDHRLLIDKLDAHQQGVFHLAVENSNHPYYFTEKLTDPLLVGNHVFYGGNRLSRRLFNTQTVTPISWRSPSRTLGQIRKVIDTYDPSHHRGAIIDNRERVLRRFNLQSEICRILESDRVARLLGQP